MKQFVVKAQDCQQSDEYVMFDSVDNGTGCLTSKENCTKFTSKEEANKALRNYQRCYCGVLKYDYIIEEIQKEETLNEKTYYVLRTFNCNNIKYQTFPGSVSIYIDKAQRFNSLEKATEALSWVHGFDICKIVEKTTSQTIDHKWELKKAKMAKLESQKQELQRKRSNLNHEIVSISNDIERIDDELQELTNE